MPSFTSDIGDNFISGADLAVIFASKPKPKPDPRWYEGVPSGQFQDLDTMPQFSIENGNGGPQQINRPMPTGYPPTTANITPGYPVSDSPFPAYQPPPPPGVYFPPPRVWDAASEIGPRIVLSALGLFPHKFKEPGNDGREWTFHHTDMQGVICYQCMTWNQDQTPQVNLLHFSEDRRGLSAVMARAYPHGFCALVMPDAQNWEQMPAGLVFEPKGGSSELRAWETLQFLDKLVLKHMGISGFYYGECPPQQVPDRIPEAYLWAQCLDRRIMLDINQWS